MKKIKINPEVLIWARESAHLEIFEIPKSIIAQEKLIKIEQGEEMLTLAQLEKLAKKYDRSLSILLSKKIPEDDYFELPFFRKENKTEYDSALTLFIRDLQKKQDWARNYFLEEGYSELDFIGSIKLSDDKKKSAKTIKEKLRLPLFSDFKKNKDYLKSIKENLENNHVFISITGSNKSNKSIDLSVAQGFAIVDDLAPFVFVNTKNTTNAKIFTMIHEIVHLFLGESGITEDAIKFRKPVCHEDEIENYCNMVASEILMPEEYFRNKFIEMRNCDLQEIISKLSQFFLVSELAICVRLWKLNLINYQTYQHVYTEIKQRIDEFLKKKRDKQKESKGGGDYYNNMRSKNGEMFSKIAYYAYQENKILGTDLYNLLRIKLDKLNTYFSAF